MIRLIPLLLLAGLVATPAQAQSQRHMLPPDEALTTEICTDLQHRLMPAIEKFTRMKFRRQVPLRIEPKAVWMARAKRKGWSGFSGRSALAYYRRGINDVTIVPWTMAYNWKTGELRKSAMKTQEEWIREVESTLIHELTHAIHFQNFYADIRETGPTLKGDGLSEEEIDVGTVGFILAEGFAEYVSLRTTAYPFQMNRHPNPDLSHGRHYFKKYRPNGKEPFRVLLSKFGYQDGLDFLHHLSLTFKAGPRGVRAILYRPPPRRLLFQPDILAKVKLDDPPEPDSIFWELYPSPSMRGVETRLAVNPGKGRYFSGACRSIDRARGCLIGYVAEADGADGATYRYAVFVSDPDDGGSWSAEQVAGLKEKKGETQEKRVPLPLAGDVKATILTVNDSHGGVYVRAEAAGLVVLAHESKPTPRLEERAVAALRVLYIKRPTPKLYDAALKEAEAVLDKKD